MEFLTTKIKLKPNVTKERMWELISLWLTKSPYYGIESVERFGEENVHEQLFDGSSLQSVTFKLDEEDILACRFEVNEPDNTWRTDCIYSSINVDKTLTINLSCTANKYSSELPKLHKPYIIKLLFDNKVCDETGVYPITDTPIMLEKNTLDKCADVMNGQLSSALPIVYVSYDFRNRELYPVDCDKLAAQLSGLAHVLVEPDIDFSLELSKKTNKNNTIMGFVGIYYPDGAYRETISFYEYIKNGIINKNALMNDIYHTVRRAAVNHVGADSRTWANVQLAQQKQKMFAIVSNANDKEKELEELKELNKMFEDENKTYLEKIRTLNDQLNNKNAQIDLLKNKHNDGDITLNRGNQNDYYTDEAYDFIVTLLANAAAKIPDGTRSKEILTELIASNPPTNFVKRVFADIKDALKSPLAERRKKLEACGFESSGSKHDKIETPDGKHTFTLANSGSDHRNPDNTYSDMMKEIDIYKNFL